MINSILEIARKTPLRPIYRWARMNYRNPAFRKTMRKIIADPRYSLDNREVLADLSYGWGNESHSANIEYLVDCARYAAQSKLPILECGSGLTTIILGLVTQKYGNTVWSLEHMKSWYKRVQKYLKKYKIDTVTISHTPLIDYNDFSWYDAPLESMPDKFSLVICDGPPKEIKGGRYGLLPVMRERLAPDCVILFDDATWEKEQANVARWAKEINMNYETRGTEMQYYVIKLK
jgi:hypothetical protein